MATAKKRGKNWRVRVYDKTTGKYKSFTAPTKNEAEKLGTEFLESRREKQDNSKVTVYKAMTAYINERNNILSPASIDKYERTRDKQFSKDFLNTKVSKLTNELIQKEINRISGIYSPKTVKNAYNFLYTVIKKYRLDLCNNIMLPKVQIKHKELATVEEIIRIFKNDRIEIVVLLALCLGLRKEEIRGLKKSDFKNNVMTINRVVIDVKGERIEKENAKTILSKRQLKVPEYIMNMINEIDGEYITEMSGQAIYKHFSRVMKKNGYNMCFHDLRHVNASVMLALKVPNKYAMERGGWATDETLKKVYQQTFSDERQKFDSLIDNYFEEIYDQKHDHSKDKRRKYRIIRRLD